MLNPFIDAEYFKKQHSIDVTVDDKLIEPSIEKAQDKYILDLLGTGLYLELQSQIQGSTVSSVNQLLLDAYIAPTLSNYALYEGFEKLYYRIENIGILKRSGEFAESISLSELKHLKDIVKDDAEFFATKLTKYLQANYTLFPLYLNPGNSLDTVYPIQESWTSPMYFRKRK